MQAKAGPARRLPVLTARQPPPELNFSGQLSGPCCNLEVRACKMACMATSIHILELFPNR
jgi:hypothetical protein